MLWKLYLSRLFSLFLSLPLLFSLSLHPSPFLFLYLTHSHFSCWNYSPQIPLTRLSIPSNWISVKFPRGAKSNQLYIYSSSSARKMENAQNREFNTSLISLRLSIKFDCPHKLSFHDKRKAGKSRPN